MSVTSAHDLFAVDPVEFVAARDALVRELRASGQRDDAGAVKAMRRPSVPTWALNRVARDDADVAGALLQAAAAARSMQDHALEGAVDGDALRGALADRRAALRDVMSRASAVIDASERASGSLQRQLETTLTAVIASDRLSGLWRAGELVDVSGDEPDDDLASLLTASVPARAPSKPAVPKAKSPLRVVPDDAATAAVSEATTRAAERRRAASREVAKAERAVDKTRAALDAAREKVAAAEQAHDAAAAALAHARRELDDASG